MRKLELTVDMIRMASMDAGNRSMRKAGRSAWNDDDFDAATAEWERLRPSADND